MRLDRIALPGNAVGAVAGLSEKNEINKPITPPSQCHTTNRAPLGIPRCQSLGTGLVMSP